MLSRWAAVKAADKNKMNTRDIVIILNSDVRLSLTSRCDRTDASGYRSLQAATPLLLCFEPYFTS
jgi:hypothetical protein